MATKRSLGWFGVVLALVVACSESPSGGGSSDAGGDANGGGSGGNNGNGNGGGQGGPGSFDSIWRQASADITFFETSGATLPTTTHVDIPATSVESTSGKEVEGYLRIVDDELVVYAHSEGDDFYYRVTRPLLKADETSYLDNTSGSVVRLFRLDDGVLYEDRNEPLGEAFIATTTMYEVVAGAFPPSTWPTTVVDVEVQP